MNQIFPSHEEQLQRLRRIEGQIGGIHKMIEDHRYCIDIVSQIRAVTGALKQIQMGVLETHVHHCVRESMESKNQTQLEEKVLEIVKVLGQME